MGLHPSALAAVTHESAVSSAPTLLLHLCALLSPEGCS